MKTLGLINYEGDCLKAVKQNNEILIVDQYGETLETFTVKKFYEFICGLVNVVDSKGKTWNYPSEHVNARPSMETINQFVKDIKDINIKKTSIKTVNQFIKELQMISEDKRKLPVVIECPNGELTSPSIKMVWNTPVMVEESPDKILIGWK